MSGSSGHIEKSTGGGASPAHLQAGFWMSEDEAGLWCGEALLHAWLMTSCGLVVETSPPVEVYRQCLPRPCARLGTVASFEGTLVQKPSALTAGGSSATGVGEGTEWRARTHNNTKHDVRFICKGLARAVARSM
jgi:hypothetical protein